MPMTELDGRGTAATLCGVQQAVRSEYRRSKPWNEEPIAEQDIP